MGKIALGQLLIQYKVQQKLTELENRPTVQEIMELASGYNVEGDNNLTIYIPKEDGERVVDTLTGLTTDVSLQKLNSSITIISVDVNRVKDIITLGNMLDDILEYSTHSDKKEKIFVAMVNGVEIKDVLRMEKPA